jgi:hypothetical protein
MIISTCTFTVHIKLLGFIIATLGDTDFQITNELSSGQLHELTLFNMLIYMCAFISVKLYSC